MKAVISLFAVSLMFLSDLCGREECFLCLTHCDKFLSDLCGREENGVGKDGKPFFLSDLCGREELL